MIKGFTPFALGFRPFFSCAGVAAVLLLMLWLGFWSGHIPPNSYYGIIGWHSHEMLFGYTTAIIAGFLLTAVRNWTGINTVTGTPLAALAALWLLGRIMPFLPLPGGLIALVDLGFFPLLAVALYKPLMEGEAKANRIFLVVLALTTIANLLVHLQALKITTTTAQLGTGMMRYLIVWLLVIITGRVMPFFTRSTLPGSMPQNRDSVERYSVILLLGLMLAELFIPAPWLVGSLAALLAISQIIRVAGWYDQRIWSVPILWVLYTGYFWLIAGFLLQALSTLNLVAPNLALHAITMGTIGIFTLGMMARVSLGHTGRPMQSAKIINAAFVLINVGTAVRVLLPIIAPQQYQLWIFGSGALWLISFLIYCSVYIPILMRPRIDGQPG